MAMVPVCWGLRLNGHDVLVACPPDLAGTVRSAGLSAVTIGEEVRLLAEIAANASPEWYPSVAFADRTSEWGRMVWELSTSHQVQYAAGHARAYLEFAQGWEPDLVLYDHITYTGRLVAAGLGVPSVSHRWGVDPTAGPFEDKVRADLLRTCAELGLPDFPEPDVLLDPCPPSMQVPDAPAGRPVRYVPFNGTGLLPDWAREPTRRPRICVCLGGTTLDVIGPRPVHRVAEAVAGRDDLDVIFALTAANREAVGALPDSVRVVEALPLSLFLESCSAVVSTGGSGTGLTATVFGVPQLVLPQWFDQFDYGSRLAAAGAGITVPTKEGQDDVAGLAAALDRLLTDPHFSTATEKLAAEIQAAPSPGEVAQQLAALV
jgi:UDP:flavonoid glycosyltransferase YjiC (YdhE family)